MFDLFFVDFGVVVHFCFVAFVDSFIVTVSLVLVKTEGWLDFLCLHECKHICFDSADDGTRFLFMLMFLCVRERVIFSLPCSKTLFICAITLMEALAMVQTGKLLQACYIASINSPKFFARIHICRQLVEQKNPDC